MNLGELLSRVLISRVARPSLRPTLLCVFALLLFLHDATSSPSEVAATGGPGGAIGTFAGGSPATSAILSGVWDVAFDSAGNLYIAEGDAACSVRKVSSGIITRVAGNGDCAFYGDGGPATTAAMRSPRGVAVDAAGDIYIADSFNCRIRKVNGGLISTVAGNGTCGYSGDDGPATSAALDGPRDVAVDVAGDLYIADTMNCRVRKVSGGIITSVAGNGMCGYGGDGGAATSALLNHPTSVTFDSALKLYIVDGSCRIRKVHTGTITTLAGNGACAYSGDGGLANRAGLHYPAGAVVDAGGNLYISEWGSCRLRRVTGDFITTAAGDGVCGFYGDGGPAASAALDQPAGLALDSAANPYIADHSNCRVRKISGGMINIVAGSGPCSAGPDTDQDGCTDTDESQVAMGSETSGGRRNHNNFWDFYDVWTQPDPVGQPTLWTRDKEVNVVGDILGVAQRFGATRPGGAPSEAVALTEALTPPTSDTGYHADYDRGMQIGPNVWDLAGPDGGINVVTDILGVARQFAHSCL